jgi:hypothetical protein
MPSGEITLHWAAHGCPRSSAERAELFPTDCACKRGTFGSVRSLLTGQRLSTRTSDGATTLSIDRLGLYEAIILEEQA